MTDGKKPNPFMAPLTPSPELAAVIGPEARPRTQITKDVWAYIKSYQRQDPVDRRMINADDKLRAVFGKDQVSMFEMTKILTRHLTKA